MSLRRFLLGLVQGILSLLLVTLLRLNLGLEIRCRVLFFLNFQTELFFACTVVLQLQAVGILQCLLLRAQFLEMLASLFLL